MTARISSLPTAMHWSSSMANSLMLVEKMSDLANIAHNFKSRNAMIQPAGSIDGPMVPREENGEEDTFEGEDG
jgi:hypothetical protein